MKNERVRIALDDLPPRAHRPTEAQLGKVFGGSCARPCQVTDDCRPCGNNYFCWRGHCAPG